MNAAPWNERGPVDELIDLQQQAFQADSDGARGQFGSIVMKMSQIESAIGNHSEAAAYATEATSAFEEAGHLEHAIAAHSILAREHRTLGSPDLALASLQDIIRLKVNGDGGMLDTPKPIASAEVMPILRLILSRTAGYRSGSFKVAARCGLSFDYDTCLAFLAFHKTQDGQTQLRQPVCPALIPDITRFPFRLIFSLKLVQPFEADEPIAQLI